MGSMSTFLVVGSINYDMVMVVPEQPGPHTKVRALSKTDMLGGAAANTATWLATLGDDVSLVGRVGADSHGTFCLEELDRLGVGRTTVVVAEDAPTSIAVCWSAGTDKRIVTHSGGAQFIVPDLACDPAQQATVHVAMPETDSLVAALRRAHSTGVRISLELDGRSMPRARELASLAFINSRELAAVFGIDWRSLRPADARRLLPRAEAALVVTVGTDRVCYVDHTDVVTLPVVAVEVVDRTGGGDAFDAGFLHAWAAGSAPATCLEVGLATSTRVLRKVGATP
jgi:ribokinase